MAVQGLDHLEVMGLLCQISLLTLAKLERINQLKS